MGCPGRGIDQGHDTGGGVSHPTGVGRGEGGSHPTGTGGGGVTAGQARAQ